MALTQNALRPQRHLVSVLTAQVSSSKSFPFRRNGHVVIGDVLYICNKSPFAIWWNFRETSFDDFTEDLASVHGPPPSANFTNIRERLVRDRTLAIWSFSSIIQQMPKSVPFGM